MSIENYPIFISHQADGMEPYEKDLFDREKYFLEKILNKVIKNGYFPRIGESMFGEGQIYYIKSITYFENSIRICVDDDEFRVI